MPLFEESGLRVTLPDERSFRFSTCRGYQRVSGRKICEMDFGWWDEAQQLIVLLEIKDYSKYEQKKDLPASLLAKGRDCLVMLHAVWHELSEIGRTLSGELPEQCRKPQKLHFYFVLKVGQGAPSRELILPIKDHLQNHIKAYAELLGMKLLKVFLLDYETAMKEPSLSTVIEC